MSLKYKIKISLSVSPDIFFPVSGRQLCELSPLGNLHTDHSVGMHRHYDGENSSYGLLNYFSFLC